MCQHERNAWCCSQHRTKAAAFWLAQSSIPKSRAVLRSSPFYTSPPRLSRVTTTSPLPALERLLLESNRLDNCYSPYRSVATRFKHLPLSHLPTILSGATPCLPPHLPLRGLPSALVYRRRIFDKLSDTPLPA